MRGLDGGGRSTVTSGVSMTTEQRGDNDLQAPVDDELHKHFRTQVGKLQWLAQVRPDLQHGVMRLSRKVSAPSLWDVHGGCWFSPRRVGRCTASPTLNGPEMCRTGSDAPEGCCRWPA